MSIDVRSQAPPRAPEEPRAPGVTSARRAIALAIVALGIAGLLNADAMRDTAASQPFGWRRDVALALVQPFTAVSHALRLNLPRKWLDEIVHPSAAPAPEPTPTSQPTPTVSPTPTRSSPAPPGRRLPTAADPLRIWLGGESMAMVLSPSIVNAAADTGVATVRHDLHVSSGLTRPDFFNWPAEIRRVLSARNAPEAIVFMVGANDAQGIVTPRGTARFGTSAWIAEYRARVDAVMKLFVANGRAVYWIGQPVMRSDSLSAHMRVLDDIYRTEAARYGVRYVDSWRLFADARGDYAESLVIGGRLVVLRQKDGVHFTRAGADRLARAVMAAISADWRLP